MVSNLFFSSFVAALAFKNARINIPMFGFGGGCGVGGGFGYGVFLFGIGTPLFRVSQLLGFEDRRMERAYRKARLEKRQPLRTPAEEQTRLEDVDRPDAVLDKFLRLVRERRARHSQMNINSLPPSSP